MSDSSALMKTVGSTNGYGATATVDESVEAPTRSENSSRPTRSENSSGRKVAIALLVLLVLGTGVFFAAKHSTAVLEWQANFVDEHHSLGIVVCIAVFLPWIVLCLPTTLYEILVGFMFGVWLGAAINAIGKLIGSCTSFMLGKCCLAERVNRMAVDSWRIQRIKTLLAEQPWRVAFIVRAAQIPIAIKNYGASAADLKLVVFVTSCIVVDSLSGLAWAWIGSSAESLSSVFTGDAKQGGAQVQQVMLIVGMVAAFAMVSGFGVWAKKNLMGDAPEAGEPTRVQSSVGAEASVPASTAASARSSEQPESIVPHNSN